MELGIKGSLIHYRDDKLFLGEYPKSRLLRVCYDDNGTFKVKDKRGLVYVQGERLILERDAPSKFSIELVEERREPESPYLLFFSNSSRFSACEESGEWVIYSGDVYSAETTCIPIELVGLRYRGWKTNDKKPFRIIEPGKEPLDAPWNDELIVM
ncbi:hypothetical protein POMI540_2170 [Schizosaccharomyces pombe]